MLFTHVIQTLKVRRNKDFLKMITDIINHYFLLLPLYDSTGSEFHRDIAIEKKTVLLKFP